MKINLVKINEQHYVVCDDSEIKEGDFGWDVYEKKIFQAITFKGVKWNGKTKNRYFKITHSTQPLEYDDYLMDKQKVLPLSISEVKETIYGYSVEKMAEKACENKFSVALAMDYWKEGFNAHKELVKDKLFTVGDIEKAVDMARQGIFFKVNDYETDKEWDYNESQIIQSLLPKTEWECTIDERGKITVL